MAYKTTTLDLGMCTEIGRNRSSATWKTGHEIRTTKADDGASLLEIDYWAKDCYAKAHKNIKLLCNEEDWNNQSEWFKFSKVESQSGVSRSNITVELTGRTRCKKNGSDGWVIHFLEVVDSNSVEVQRLPDETLLARVQRRSPQRNEPAGAEHQRPAKRRQLNVINDCSGWVYVLRGRTSDMQVFFYVGSTRLDDPWGRINIHATESGCLCKRLPAGLTICQLHLISCNTVSSPRRNALEEEEFNTVARYIQEYGPTTVRGANILQDYGQPLSPDQLMQIQHINNLPYVGGGN